MIANILGSVNSTSIAIQAFVRDEADKFPTLTHPNSVVFSRDPLSRDALRGKLGNDRVPGIITGLGFENMAPFEPTGADWVNLRERSSDIVAKTTSEPVGMQGGRPLFGFRSTATALVVDPVDIRAAIKKGVVATIPTWEVEYVCTGRSSAPNQTTTLPPVRLSGILGRLGKNHSFKLYATPGGTVYDVYTMTTTKRAAAVKAMYRPFSEL